MGPTIINISLRTKPENLNRSRYFKLLLAGLEGSGKTTLLYKLKLGEVVTTIPTIGFNVENISYKKQSFSFWDVGGQEKIRPLWAHYVENTVALVWVIDSNESDDRINESFRELEGLLKRYSKAPAVLVFLNKQDLPKAKSVSTIVEMGSSVLNSKLTWYSQASCSTSGDGLWEGLEWLSKTLNKK